MARKTRSFLGVILKLVNVFFIILYLFVCLVPFINTGKFWFIALPGLAFALILAAMVAFLIIWAIARSRWFWVCLVVILLGIQQIMALLAFHVSPKFTLEKQANTLRVLHWNVESWDDSPEQSRDRDNSFRPQMMALIEQQNADVLCFEEYADVKNLDDARSNARWITRMGFPYYVYAQTSQHDYNRTQQGVIIFSKYPIVQSDTFNYGAHTHAEHLIYADIKKGDKIIRVFTTHLQSVRFEYNDYESLSRLKHAKDPGYHDSRTIVSKLKNGYQHRYAQALLVKEKLAESPYPAIITGDFNDVPNSNTYFTIRGKLQDTFLKKGAGIGRSFRYISPTLRIDYIFADKSLQVQQFRVIHVPYSDHYPVETDLGW